MKKVIEILLVAILLAVLSIIIIFAFNPFELRTKIIGSVLNSLISSTIKDYEPLNVSDSINNIETKTTEVKDKNPLLNEDQEKTLEGYGVDVSKLPTEVTPAMETCFFEKLGKERGLEIVAGASPSVLELLKVKSCLGM